MKKPATGKVLTVIFLAAAFAASPTTAALSASNGDALLPGNPKATRIENPATQPISLAAAAPVSGPGSGSVSVSGSGSVNGSGSSAGSLDNDRYLKAAMSVGAVELSEITGVTPLMRRLHKEQEHARTLPAGSVDMERILTMQRLIYLRSQIDAFIQTASLEVGSVLGKLNSGLAELADRKAMISDQRARTLRRTSFINLVSGGLTKIGGYSIALTPGSLIPTNVLEVFDGTVQTSLSAFTIRQQKEEQQLSKARPDILNVFLSGNNMKEHLYPDTVWTFLNRPSPKSVEGKTRREVLIDNWIRIGRLSDGRNKNVAKRASNQPTVVGERFRLDDLDDTVAMTSDLKSVIAGMDTTLMELGQAYRDTYKDDPEI